MAFKGTLREFKVPDILQLISLQKKTGILTFNSQEGFITLIFEDGFIIGIDAFPKKLEMRVGNVFVKQEIISEEMLQRALSIQKRTNQKVGEILIGMGLIDEKIIPEVLKIQATQIVLSLFNWKKGEYNFKVLDYVDKELRLLSPIAVDNLIMEGVQMLDEWPLIKKVIPSEDIVFEPVFLGSKKIALISEYDDDMQVQGQQHPLPDRDRSQPAQAHQRQKHGQGHRRDGPVHRVQDLQEPLQPLQQGVDEEKGKNRDPGNPGKEAVRGLGTRATPASSTACSIVLLALLVLPLLLTFFTPLRPIDKKNMLLKTQLYRLPARDPARSLSDEIPHPPGKTTGPARWPSAISTGFMPVTGKILETLRQRCPAHGNCFQSFSPFTPSPRLFPSPHPVDQHRQAAAGNPAPPVAGLPFFHRFLAAVVDSRPRISSAHPAWTPCR